MRNADNDADPYSYSYAYSDRDTYGHHTSSCITIG